MRDKLNPYASPRSESYGSFDELEEYTLPARPGVIACTDGGFMGQSRRLPVNRHV
jgi:hypothetical protein